MKIKDFIKKMDKICPPELAEEWDNSGIQIEAGDSVSKVLVALEVTERVIEEAKSLGVDMVVTHHPLFFGGFKSITNELLPGKYSLELIKNGISVYSAHTNFDIMNGGNNDFIAKLIGISDIKAHGIIRTGRLRKTLTLKELAIKIAKDLDIEPAKIRMIGNPEQKIKKLCWCTGAGSEYIMDSYDLKSDVYITGDVKYHDAVTIDEFGMNCLDIGHFGSEKIFTENMASIIKKHLKGLEVIESKKDMDPFKTI